MLLQKSINYNIMITATTAKGTKVDEYINGVTEY
jgi:hypothetical protein